MESLKEFLKFSATYLTPDECKAIEQAYIFAEQAHRGQMRVSGEPYIIHPIAVAQILAHYYLDSQSLQAALLHDVLEDTPISKEELSELFGSKVADLVDGVSKLKRIKFESRAHEQAENLRKMMFAVAQDIRVLLIKLADRLHNMRTLSYMSRRKQVQKAKETIDIYAPIAHRLGMNALKKEFEDLGMKALHPWRYAVIEKRLSELEPKEHEVKEIVYDKVKTALTVQKINFQDFFFRRKNIHSLYKKIQRKRVRFTDITDLAGFRVLVYSAQDCYRVLGTLHSLYRPILTKFKDYIAIPKANGYQSLHTTIIAPNGMPIEFQIRTIQMDAIAQKGIAAHWVYKNDEEITDQQNIRAYQWIKNVIDLQKTSRTPIEFIENMKIDLNPEELYIFDEKSNIWILSRDSTPIDLAFTQSIKSGNTCVACRIDNKFMPLSTPLQSGQRVEIITSPGATPNPSWLTFAVSGKARAHIRNYLCNQQYQHALDLGEKLLSKELRSYSLTIEHLKSFFDNALNTSTFTDDTFESLLSDVGMGRRLSHVVAQQFCQVRPGSKPLEIKDATPLAIDGTEKYVLTYASCCYPIPDDSIVGFRTPGEGIVIHRTQCQQVSHHLDRDDKLSLVWEPDKDTFFKAEICIKVTDDVGTLALLAQAIARYDSNIVSILTQACDANYQDITVVLYVKNLAHLELIEKKIRSLHRVHSVSRV